MEDFLNCLSCGKTLGAKSKHSHGQCTECLLKLEFKTEDTDFEFIQKYLQGILDFFVSDVSAAFNKDPAARTLIEVLTSYPGIKAVLLYRISMGSNFSLSFPYSFSVEGMSICR